MGFGILFIGYFLLLNLTYYGYTDIIAGLIMLMAFYKLRSVNKYFAIGIFPSALFAVIGIPELIEALGAVFGTDISYILDYTAAPRYLIIGLITVLLLMGIESVAREVDAMKTAIRAKVTTPFAYIVFIAAVIMEFPAIEKIIDVNVLRYIGFALLLSVFVLMAAVLYSIYSAYRWICMPEDVDNDVKDKPSRFEFVNKFRERNEEKSREYAEYKLDKMKNKVSSKSAKKKNDRYKK